VLGHSRARGSARLLIAGIAALADEHGVVEGLTTELVCKAAAISDRTYRRAHGPLLGSWELVLGSHRHPGLVPLVASVALPPVIPVRR
jgi:hypothetical protein